jgi:hypothetical protein
VEVTRRTSSSRRGRKGSRASCPSSEDRLSLLLPPPISSNPSPLLLLLPPLINPLHLQLRLHHQTPTTTCAALVPPLPSTSPITASSRTNSLSASVGPDGGRLARTGRPIIGSISGPVEVGLYGKPASPLMDGRSRRVRGDDTVSREADRVWDGSPGTKGALVRNRRGGGGNGSITSSRGTLRMNPDGRISDSVNGHERRSSQSPSHYKSTFSPETRTLLPIITSPSEQDGRSLHTPTPTPRSPLPSARHHQPGGTSIQSARYVAHPDSPTNSPPQSPYRPSPRSINGFASPYPIQLTQGRSSIRSTGSSSPKAHPSPASIANHLPLPPHPDESVRCSTPQLQPPSTSVSNSTSGSPRFPRRKSTSPPAGSQFPNSIVSSGRPPTLGAPLKLSPAFSEAPTFGRPVTAVSLGAGSAFARRSSVPTKFTAPYEINEDRSLLEPQQEAMGEAMGRSLSVDAPTFGRANSVVSASSRNSASGIVQGSPTEEGAEDEEDSFVEADGELSDHQFDGDEDHPAQTFGLCSTRPAIDQAEADTSHSTVNPFATLASKPSVSHESLIHLSQLIEGATTADECRLLVGGMLAAWGVKRHGRVAEEDEGGQEEGEDERRTQREERVGRVMGWLMSDHA